MKNKYKILLLSVCITFNPFLWKGGEIFAQNNNIDSLLTLLKIDKPDTNKVNHLSQLIREFELAGDYEKGLKSGAEAIELARKLNFRQGIANSTYNLGNIYIGKAEYSIALECFNKALKHYEALKNKKGIATCIGSIGVVAIKYGNYPEALHYYFKALKIAEEIGDKNRIAIQLGNIGIVYKEQGYYPKALEYCFKALKMQKEPGNKNHIASLYGSIGTIYSAQAYFPQALDYYNKALAIAELSQDKSRIAIQYGNIGIVFEEQGNYPKALEYYFKTLKIAEELGDKYRIAIQLLNIGIVYNTQKEHFKALDFYFHSLKIAEEIGDKTLVADNFSCIGVLYTTTCKFKEAEQFLQKALSTQFASGALESLKHTEMAISQLYEKKSKLLSEKGRFDEALKNYENSIAHYKKSIALSDTIYSRESKKQFVQKEMNYEFEKKEANTKAETEKTQAIAEEKNRKQTVVIWSVVCGLFFVLLFTAFVLRSLQITSKQKQIIEIKNSETEQQKKIIEEKSKGITDSIHYAKRIQDALLREEAHVSMHLPEHFILFMPKDIVSGDFYWGAEKQGYWYFAVVDCTGHGVPGAVMSMLGIAFLNDIVFSEGLLSPAEVLGRLREKVVKELRQTGNTGGNRDGMDVSFARLNLTTFQLQWAGANDALNLIKKGQREEIKADKQPIGYHPESRPFTNHEIQLEKGDSIYIYSDGYADQFGGTKGKKFKYKQLEELIVANKHLTMMEQKQVLKDCFMEWKGVLEQVDDVCVFGVRV